MIGPANDRPVQLVVRDADGAVIGGLLGNTKWGWLYVDKLWISDAARGRGIGSRLLVRAEEIARERGCVGAYLSTFEHQARPFYEQRGYQRLRHARWFSRRHAAVLPVQAIRVVGTGR